MRRQKVGLVDRMIVAVCFEFCKRSAPQDLTDGLNVGPSAEAGVHVLDVTAWFGGKVGAKEAGDKCSKLVAEREDDGFVGFVA